jgi:hypothetical protein
MGVFLSMLAVGMLYYLAGVGEALTYRERMLDGSDAMAFGGAVLHARAMNVLVLLNQTIASVFAVAVAAKAASILVVAAGIAAASECPTSPSACAAAACLFLTAMPQSCASAGERADIAAEVAGTASSAADAMLSATRLAAAASGREIAAHYSPPVAEGTIVAAAAPVVPESPPRVCDEVLAFSGPSGEVGDAPLLVTAEHAYREARRFAGACGAEEYVDRAGGIVTATLAAGLVCGDVASTIDGHTRAIREDVRMGDDAFQVYAYVRADAEAMPFEPSAERVAVVTWGEEVGAPSSLEAQLEETVDQSVSRAEYFYDDETDPALWLWRMRWRARLRRVAAENPSCPLGVYSCVELGLGAIH